jgi:xanthine dehydrogenase accessory factor
MGSTRTSAKRRERLLQLDLSEQEISRLHAPVGLAIGSKTPAEIAIAILAQLTALRSMSENSVNADSRAATV